MVKFAPLSVTHVSSWSCWKMIALDASLEKTLVSYIFNAIILHNYSLSSPHFRRITMKTSLKNILYGHQHHQQHIQIEFNDEIFNEALISTSLGNKIKNRPYHRHFRERSATIYPSCRFLFSTIYQNLLLNKMKHMSSQCKVTKRRLFFLNVLGDTEKTLSILSLQTCIKIDILHWWWPLLEQLSLLPGGWTVHSTFKLSLNLSNIKTSKCNIWKRIALVKYSGNVFSWSGVHVHKATFEVADKTRGNKSVVGSDCCHSRRFLTNIILANDVSHHLIFNLLFRSYSSQKHESICKWIRIQAISPNPLILCDEKVNSRCKWPNWH